MMRFGRRSPAVVLIVTSWPRTSPAVVVTASAVRSGTCSTSSGPTSGRPAKEDGHRNGPR